MQVQDLADVWLDSDHASTAGLACILYMCMSSAILAIQFVMPCLCSSDTVTCAENACKLAQEQIRNTAENYVSNIRSNLATSPLFEQFQCHKFGCHTQVPFNSLGPVYQVLNKHNAQQRTEQYSEAGEVTIDVEVAISSLEEMKQDMLDATHGVVKPELLQ